MNKRNFISNIKHHLAVSGFTLRLIKDTYIDNNGVACSGYFSIRHRQLVVAYGNPKWFETAIHEYCHFLQYIEDCPIWKTFQKHKGKWWRGIMDNNPTSVKAHFTAVRNVELDCEKRVVRMIEEYNLPISKEKHIQKSNYIMFLYKYNDATGKYGRLSYHKRSKLEQLMPITFLKLSDYNSLPKLYESYFKKHIKLK